MKRVPKTTAAMLFLAMSAAGGQNTNNKVKICNGMEKHTVQECGRCIVDEMCPVGWECHIVHKLCWNPNKNGAPATSSSSLSNETTTTNPCLHAGASNCTTTTTTTTVGYKIEDECDAQINTPVSGLYQSAGCYHTKCTDTSGQFTCASGCVNEDFPCRWVDACGIPTSMSVMSFMCVRGCQNYDKNIFAAMKYQEGVTLSTSGSCVDAKKQVGCEEYKMMDKHCPRTCDTQKCPTMCDRDEIPGIDGQKCWKKVLQDGKSCAELIPLGYDCSCICGTNYQAKWVPGGSLTPGFTPKDVFGGDDSKPLGVDVTYSSGQIFNLQVAGYGLNNDRDDTNQASRLKITLPGQLCSTGVTPEGVSGAFCFVNSINKKIQCNAKPALAYNFMQQFNKIQISQCGEYKVCHCNTNCLGDDYGSGYYHVGKILIVQPSREDFNGFAQAPEGCPNPRIDGLTFELKAGSKTMGTGNTTVSVPKVDLDENGKEVEDKSQEGQLVMTTILRGFDAGTLNDAKWKESFSKAVIVSIQTYSAYLKKWVPEASDILITTVADATPFYRRRLGLTWSQTSKESEKELFSGSLEKGSPSRKLVSLSETCEDAPADSPDYFKTAGGLGSDCVTSAGTFGVKPFCTDKSIKDAVAKGCRGTCQGCKVCNYLASGPCGEQADEADPATPSTGGTGAKTGSAGSNVLPSSNPDDQETVAADGSIASSGNALTLETQGNVPAGKLAYIYVNTHSEWSHAKLKSKIKNVIANDNYFESAVYHLLKADNVTVPNEFYVEAHRLKQNIYVPPPPMADKKPFTEHVAFLAIMIGLGSIILFIVVFFCFKRVQYYDETGEKDWVVELFRNFVRVLLLPCILVGACGYLVVKKGKAKYMDEQPDSEDELNKPEVDERGRATVKVQKKQEDWPPYVGAEVQLKNLGKVEYNGLKGIILNEIPDKERWMVCITLNAHAAAGGENKELAVKAENLKVLKPPPQGTGKGAWQRQGIDMAAACTTAGGPNVNDTDMFQQMGDKDQQYYDYDEQGNYVGVNQMVPAARKSKRTSKDRTTRTGSKERAGSKDRATTAEMVPTGKKSGWMGGATRGSGKPAENRSTQVAPESQVQSYRKSRGAPVAR